MCKLLLLLFFTVVVHVQPQSNWFSDMDDNWEVSDMDDDVNPYYSWFKQAAKQMDMYGYAKHVGKINRGQYFNHPELNMPADRAIGYQSDFNPQDLNSGVFKYKHQGQKFRANVVHVNVGLARYVGELLTMPIGQYVQDDGTILVQTSSHGGGGPCLPNPCRNVRMPTTCTVVNKNLARCTSNPRSYPGSKLFLEENGNSFYGIPIAKGKTLVEGVVADTCEEVGMRAVCNGDSSCTYVSERCVVVAFEASYCGFPMFGIADKLCPSQNPIGCPQLEGVFNYIYYIYNWVSGAVGFVGGNVVPGDNYVSGNAATYYAYCIKN